MAQLRPTFSESWYRVVNLKARLRGSTQISRQHYRGERWYVVRDPAGNQFHRLSAAAYRFVGLLDGSRTVGEAWDLAGGQLADDAPTQPEVIQILSQLHAANLLEADITADASVLLRRHKQMRKRQMQGRLMNVLFPRIPLWDPDRFLKRWMPVMSGLLSAFGAIVWLAVVTWAIVTIAPRWQDLKTAAAHAVDIQSNGVNYIWMFLTFVVIKLIHELGHAFSCRRFGGEVHELGVMFLVFVPAPYVDASSAWSLPNKWARAFVGAGGMIFELFVAAILAFVWAYTSPDTTINQLAYNAMLIASVSTVIFNANPLLRYDGYYILSDLLEIPNLRMKATEYSTGLIKRHIFRVKSPLPLPSPVQRFWLLTYAIASGIYRIFVGIMIILVVTNQVPVLGVLMAFGGVITWVVVPIYKILNYLMLDPELHRKRTRATAFVLAVAGAIAVLIGMVRFPNHFRGIGVVQPFEQRQLRAPDEGGFIDTICVRDGDVVFGPIKFGMWTLRQGDVVAKLRNEDLDLRIAQGASKVESYRLRIDQDRASAQGQANVAMDTAQYEAAGRELQKDLVLREQMTVRATITGRVIAPKIEELKGKFLKPGEQIATVAQFDKLVVKTLLEQTEADRVHEKRQFKPEIRLAGARGKTLPGRIEDGEPALVSQLADGMEPLTTQAGGPAEINPKDPGKKQLAIPQFEVRIDLENPGGVAYTPGQRAYVRFDLGNEPLIYDWIRSFMQIVQTQSARNKWL